MQSAGAATTRQCWQGSNTLLSSDPLVDVLQHVRSEGGKVGRWAVWWDVCSAEPLIALVGLVTPPGYLI